MTNIGVTITGGSKTFYKSMGLTNGGYHLGVTSGDYGGKWNVNTDASWDPAGSKFHWCNVEMNGHRHEGYVQKQNIDSGTVSVTTDECVAEWTCIY